MNGLRGVLRPHLGAVICGALLAVSACEPPGGTGGNGGTDPQPSTPASIAKVSGDAQAAVVGNGLADSLVVRVTDSRGSSVSGASVAWSATGGSVSPASSSTSAAGQAKTRWTLGTSAGAQTATATVGSLAPVSFAATARADVATALNKVGGDQQTGTVGGALTDSVAVKVADRHGNAVSGTPITFAAAAGGSASPPSATSSAAGQAKARWTLGTTAGAQTLSASASGVSAAGFTATARADAPAALTKMTGDNQNGAPGGVASDSLAVKVADRYGNAVSGTSVAWSVSAGGGAVSPASSATDATGIGKTRWTFGSVVGTQSVSATVSSLAPVSFSAIVRSEPATSVTRVSGDAQTATVGTSVTDSITVKVVDKYGNGVSGATVIFVASPGGSVSPSTATSGSSGLARTRWTLSTTAGAQSLTATVSGLNLLSFSATARAGAARTVSKVSGDNQSADVSTALTDSLTVKVVDQYGNAVSGGAVAFSVASGSVSPSTATTNSSGLARTRWTLGSTSGTQSATATVSGAGSVNFTATATQTSSIPAVFSKYTNGVTVTREGNYIVLRSTGTPNHKSAYWPTSNALYEAYNNMNFRKNPYSIGSYNLTVKIPVNPAVASTHQATGLGAIGMALNGTAFFNQYAAGYTALDSEIQGFDQYKGHPNQNNQYHYHVEPTYLTTTNGSSSLVGFLLDGFPVYGPVENSVRLTTSSLDSYHGHTGVTEDYPNGIYHYHITDDDPYINGAGYWGTPGTVSSS